ncbi:tRNA (N(6)-L-threonylcarbamoyladenosine(37)-C(2))-methylthiotransferase MtaB [bacterium]|nr:tRNA (N(6)-L-threonylcarbamoyladenosine(37)-C(2))-methylthiotransferase MtaB [bacterium]
MPNVLFKTYGCRLNQAETAAMSASFRERGYQVTDDILEADVYVLNTCVVTARSAAKCLKDIRQAIRANPRTTVILTGCYAHLDDERLSAIGGIDYIVDNRMKYSLFDVFAGPGKQPGTIRIGDDAPENAAGALSRAGDFSHKTRAAVKVQTGCDNRCAYCIVPYTRGPSRSVPLSRVLSDVGELASRGYREIVITGVHIGDYGRDMHPPSSLSLLLESLLALPYTGRFRLSSLNGADCTDQVIEFIAGNERVCSHVHLSLQSGCDAILRTMNRSYTTDSIRRVVERLERRLGFFGLGADLITGFPGESEVQALETERFVRELPFTYLHVFPYSVRPGTPAASLPDQIAPGIKQERAARLRGLAEEKQAAFLQKNLHRTVSVLLEGKKRKGLLSGLSSEYVRVSIPADAGRANELTKVKITAAGSSELYGLPGSS